MTTVEERVANSVRWLDEKVPDCEREVKSRAHVG